MSKSNGPIKLVEALLVSQDIFSHRVMFDDLESGHSLPPSPPCASLDILKRSFLCHLPFHLFLFLL